MFEFKLSYVVTTYNKLLYLQQVMARLVAARQPDEEIVVCDGGSTDGTADYLRGLYEAGQIQQFVSERDKGEAHGFNKGMLMARGELLKLITDDDAFCYPAIREARDFMLANPQVDALSGNTWLVSLEDLTQANFYKYSLNHYYLWREHGQAVNMIGLPLILRRSSLALMGLFYTGMVQVDGEYTYRITSMNVNIAWYTRVLCVRVENPQSNFRTMDMKKSFNETDRMAYFYDKRMHHGFYHYLRYKSALSDAIRFFVSPLKRWQERRAAATAVPEPDTICATGYVPTPGEEPIAAAFAVCDQFMKTQNEKQPSKFIMRDTIAPLAKVMPAFPIA